MHSRRAFTLLELLIVIGIIGVLVAVTLAVGNAVTTGARTRLTQDTMRLLDSSLQSYVAYAGDIPSPTVDDPRPSQINRVLPVADARNMSDLDSSYPVVRDRGNQILDSTGLYLLQAGRVPSAKAIIDRIPSKVVRQQTTRVTGQPLTLTTVFDGWGRPIRYVHPAYHGIRPQADVSGGIEYTTALLPKPPKTFGITMIRRNNTTAGAIVAAQDVADSDGGSCVGGRPYFYSAGEDGDPSTIGDNVYLSTPNVPR